MLPPGEVLQVDGRAVHMIRAGMGAPTVVFEAGAGQLALSWQAVQTGVAEFTSTIAWDRPGYGWSGAPRAGLDLDGVVQVLHGMLGEAGAKPPHVMVGHSLGALYVRRFIELHPDEVAGVVLVDPTHEHQLAGAPLGMRLAFPVAMRLQGWLPGLVARSAGPRFRATARASFPALSDEDIADLVARHLAPETLRLQFAENREVLREAKRLRLAPGALGDLPLIILGAGRVPGGPRFARHRAEVQLPQLAALSTRGRVHVVADSGHGIPLERPQAVVDAVAEVVRQGC